MRKTILALALLLLPLLAAAQQRHWNEGPLALNELQSKISPDGNACHLTYHFDFELTKGSSSDGVTTTYYRADAWIDLEQCWVDANSRNDVTLRFCQLLFDLIEVKRRQMAKLLQYAGTQPMREELLYATDAALRSKIATIKSSTAEGTDTAALARWEKATRQQLDTLPIDPMPVFEPGLLSAAMALGFTFGIPTGLSADVFTSGPGIYFSYELGLKRFVLDIDCYLTNANMRVDMGGYLNDGTPHIVKEGDPASPSSVLVGAGFRVLEERNHTLTPIVAWSSGYRSFPAEKKNIISPYNGLAFGLAYRYHFSHRYRAAGAGWVMFNKPEITLWSIDTRLMLERCTYKDSAVDINGWMVFLSVGISLGGRQANIQL